MKKLVLFLMLCLVSILFAQTRQVSLRDAQSIADRNAHAKWGNQLGSATPISYYGPDDQIIAYHFNYALNKPFPEAEALKQSCDDAFTSGNRDSAFGAKEYANMVIGANRDMPVFIEYSQCLSQQYYSGKKLERVANKEFPHGYEIDKIYYLGLANVWYRLHSGKDVKYINLEPAPKVLAEEEFQTKLSSMDYFWKHDTFEADWVAFLDNNETMSRSDVMIPGEDLMPYYLWNYGCTPTSGAMLLAWWDHYKGFAKFIDYHGTRWDPVTELWSHHTPQIQARLAYNMDTDDEGGTYTNDQADGYIDTIEDLDYACSVDSDFLYPNDSVSHLWGNVCTNVNAGRPIHVNIHEHSIVGVGYILSPPQVHTHDPNLSELRTITRSMMKSTVEVVVTSGNGNRFAEIIAPNGGTNWYWNGGGENLYSGDMYEITWSTNLGEDTYAKLYYNDEGGAYNERWFPITTNTPNDGSYLWSVPYLEGCSYGSTTNYGRVKIEIYNSSNQLLAADGSYGNFNIIGDVGMPVLQSAPLSVTSSPDYFTADFYEDNTWGAVGIKDDPGNGPDIWKVELYDSPSFTNMVEQSIPNDLYNYIVINNRQLPANEWGVKFLSNSGASFAKAELSGDPGLTLAYGNNTGLSWTATNVVKMYNVYLGSNSYMFNMSISGSSADLDFALFKWGGDGIFTLSEAVASSRGGGIGMEGSESMYYNSTEAGWYGLCVSSRTTSSCTFAINITLGSKWTGAVSNVWHNAANWTSNLVPIGTTNVFIPAGCAYYPRISGVNVYVKSITIESGAAVTVADGTLTVNADLRVSGGLVLNNASSVLNVMQDVTWEAGSTGSMASTSAIYCYRHWNFNASSMVGLTSGYVYFIGSSSSRIIVNSANSYFSNLIVNKTTGDYALFSELSQQNLVIKSNLTIATGSTFKSSSAKDVVLEGVIVNNGNFQFDDGSIRFMGSAAYLNANPGDYFNNIYLGTTMPVQLTSDLHLNGDLTISLPSGTLSVGSYNIYLGGDWYNQKGPTGFVEGTGTVIFNGVGEQLCWGETFNNLEVANEFSNLTFCNPLLDSSCSSYNWTAGRLVVQEGAKLTILDLADNGLNGAFTVWEGGELDITQDAAHFVDLNGDLTINDGTVTIRGGSGESYWPFEANARIDMSSGVLDFTSCGIQIHNTATYTLDTSISGGKIRTVGNFVCNRADFDPQGGTLEMYGTGDATISGTNSSLGLNLIINKASTRGAEQDAKAVDFTAGNASNPEYAQRHYDFRNTLGSAREATATRSNTVSLQNDLTIVGSVIIESGTLNINGRSLVVEDELNVSGNLLLNTVGSSIYIATNLYWNAGATGTISTGTIELGKTLEIAAGASFVLGTGNTFYFQGIEARVINNASGSSFANVVLMSGTDALTTFMGPEPMNILGNLTVQDGADLSIDACYLSVSGTAVAGTETNLEILNAGKLTVAGNFSSEGGIVLQTGELVCHDGFTLAATGSMTIANTGKCTLDKPYTGQMFGFLGTISIGAGGILEISNNGMLIGTTRNITTSGGTIKIGWNFQATNPNTFWGNAISLEFIGARQSTISMGTGNYVDRIISNKPGTSYVLSFLSDVYIVNDLIVQGGNPVLSGHSVEVGRDVTINGGRLSVNSATDILFVGRSWINNVGISAFEEGIGTVIFDYLNDDYSGTISTETFNKVQISKYSENSIEVLPGSTVSIKAGLDILYARFALGAGSILKMNNSSELNIGSSGEFYAVGTAENPARLTADAGNYSFNTVLGSKVAAQYCIFEKMDANGIKLSIGSLVDTQYSFHNCTFQNGAAGGTLLQKLSIQIINVNNAVFPTNTWSGAYNVYHWPYPGSITFQNASGAFSGAAFENDPGNHIFWENISPNPTVVHSPLPANNATEVLLTTMLSWEYTSDPGFTDPIGYIVKMGTDPSMNVYQQGYLEGGAGTNLMQPLLTLVAGTTYYWQIIPTTEPQGRAGEHGFVSKSIDRGDATNCPMWSFTTAMGTLEAPQNLIINIQNGNAVLNWSAVTNANSYKIYRTTDPGSPDWGIPIATTPNPGWTDLTLGTLYFYKVIASTD